MNNALLTYALAFVGGIAFLFLIMFLFYAVFQDSVPEMIHAHWSHYIPDLQFSSQDFYTSIETILTEREMPNSLYQSVEFSERGGVFSSKRLYLRVRYGAYSFDVCAAPFGTGYFISWWFGENIGCLTRLLLLVPFLNIYIRAKLSKKTYFIIDSEDMFQKATHLAVMESLDAITAEKGLRQLSELERQPINTRKPISPI